MKTLTSSAVALVALAFSAPGLAATLSCPDDSSTLVTDDNVDVERTVTIDPTSSWSCGAAGVTPGGNPEGGYFKNKELTELEKIDDGDGGQVDGTNTKTYISISGLGEAGKVDGVNDGNPSGSFSIAGGLEKVTFVFKFGKGDPDWISFVWATATGDGWSGTWETNLKTALSHVTLYGTEKGDYVSPEKIPEPATLMLLGMGLLGLGALRHRRMV